ncbi:MAG TPA: hypothetical protein VFJ17_03390 [Mycobacteriales bacterium]|jgi:hypothetical protein|nr:hypothetical protein [Mycobacteriales bacterium]
MPLVVRRALLVALPPWLVSRALTAAGLWVCWLRNGHRFPVSGHGAPGASGIWAWDAAWYRSIAEHGYAAQLHPHGERFFPLFPLLGRCLGAVLGGHDGLALVLVANAAALAFGVGVAVFARRELGEGAAVLATWLTLLAPGAVVLSIGYAEALAGVLAVAYLLAARSRGSATWWAVPAGLLSGLARPTGLLLAVVPVVELWLSRRDREARPSRLALLSGAAAPVVGVGIFCVWTAAVDGDLLLPFTAQSAPGLRGGLFTNPVHGLFEAPNRSGLPVALRVGVVLVALALLVLTWRLLPRSIAVWATVFFLAAVTSAQATSLPRYLSADFPLLVALAGVLRGRLQGVLACGLSATAFTVVAVSGFGAGMLF